LPYVFADFINAEGAEIVEHYRRNFRPSTWLSAPYTMVACWVVCASTREEAVWLSSSMRMLLTLLRRGQLVAVPSPAKASEFLQREGLAQDGAVPGRRFIAGDPGQVQAGLRALDVEYGGADEFLLVNVLFDHQARLRSYQLTAREFSLPQSGTEQRGPINEQGQMIGHNPELLFSST
jgi:alkanesulfonate monooxygenase SsuD/methylene tetrahydromethanopterin reductase-like flavin-dependent oxidoreductase (luciferase family)